MPFVSMIMVRSMSQTTERFNLCSANGFVLARRGFVRFIETAFILAEKCCLDRLFICVRNRALVPTFSHGNSYIFYEVANSYEFIRPHSYNVV